MLLKIIFYDIIIMCQLMLYGQSNEVVSAFANFSGNNASIVFVGDIMVHEPQLNAQYDKSTNTFNFDNNFKYVKKYIESADIAVCNLETVTAGEEEGGYTSFPRFNSPDTIIDALKEAGFDLLCIANNHLLDRKAYGMERTMDVITNKNLIYTGARKKDTEKNYVIFDINNIKVGITAYTYESDLNGQDTLNGNPIPKGYKALINTFDYTSLGNDLENMKYTIDKMKEDGAECIIFELHWGNEYQDNANKYQQAIAEYLCKNGVHVIVGTHPHILQKFDTIEMDGHTTHVFYSIGNFLSNQRYEILKHRKSENGIIIGFQVLKDAGNNIIIENLNYVPTWISKYYENNKWVYEILPLNEDLSKFKLDYKDNLWRAENALKTIKAVIKKGSMRIAQINN